MKNISSIKKVTIGARNSPISGTRDRTARGSAMEKTGIAIKLEIKEARGR